MPGVLSYEQFRSQVRKLWQEYQMCVQQDPENVRLKKARATLSRVPKLYGQDKVYAVKILRRLDTHMVFFAGKQRAVLVRYVELLQKLILHKKLTRSSG